MIQGLRVVAKLASLMFGAMGVFILWNMAVVWPIRAVPLLEQAAIDFALALILLFCAHQLPDDRPPTRGKTLIARTWNAILD